MSEELSRAGEPMFTLVRRGYDQVEVDGYVSQLHHQLRGLQKPDQAVTDALDRVGNEVADILKKAHETAREIVETAERQAATTKQDADRHAVEVVANAEKRLQEIDIDTDRVWAERARIIGDVRELSRQLLGVADLADERFPDEATGEFPQLVPATATTPATAEFPTVPAADATEAGDDDQPAVAADEQATAVHVIGADDSGDEAVTVPDGEVTAENDADETKEDA